MAFIPVPNVVQTELLYTWQGQECATILAYVSASPWNISKCEELGDGLEDAIQNGMRGFMSNTLQFNGIRFVDLSDQNGFVFDYVTGFPKTGALTGASMPNNVACVVTKRTPLRGRSFRGRIYMPGLTEDNVTANAIAGSLVTAYISFWNACLSFPLTADEALLCVVSRQSNNAPRTTGLATVVTHFTCDGIIDSQRRRLPGRGA